MPDFTAFVNTTCLVFRAFGSAEETVGLVLETSAVVGAFAAQKLRDATMSARNRIVGWIEGEGEGEAGRVEAIPEGDEAV